MKTFKKLTAVILLLLVSVTVTAQGKVAHIDFQTLISQMPEFIEAQAQLQKLQNTYQTDLEQSAKEYQTKLQTYNADAQNQTDATNQARMKELAGMEQNLQQYNQSATQDVQKKQNDLIVPISEKARAAIKKIAMSLGYDYVVDKQMTLVSEGKDLMEEVKKELGF